MSPIIVDDAGSVNWDRQADVVVVGFGGAGASAALEAREAGADVILIDRFGGGGTTGYSGGVIYAGATRFQREAGFADTVDNMHAYLEMEVGDAVRPETLRRFCEGSAADVDWLIGHGVRYASDAYLDKITYPPEGKFLYYSGNEKSPAFAEKAEPAPRGHRAVGAGFRRRALHRGAAPGDRSQRHCADGAHPRQSIGLRSRRHGARYRGRATRSGETGGAAGAL